MFIKSEGLHGIACPTMLDIALHFSVKDKLLELFMDTQSIPSNLSPCPWPRHSGDTVTAATSPHLSSKKGKRAAHAIIEPSLSTTIKESNEQRSWKQGTSYKYKLVKYLWRQKLLSSFFIFTSYNNQNGIKMWNDQNILYGHWENK